jgi:glutathione synthase/RimK-type ligase-like ATP-grasp enzyme
VAKTVAGARLRRAGAVQVIYTVSVTCADLGNDAELASAPVIWQRLIRPVCDLRATVVGDEIFAARISIMDRTDAEVDWRAVETNRVQLEPCRLPPKIAELCFGLLASLDLTFGAIDFIIDPEGCYYFLEINPAGQWGWIEKALRMPITDAILDRLQRQD